MSNSQLTQKNSNAWTVAAFSLGVALPVFSTFINVIFTKIIGQNSFDTIVSYGLFAFLVFMSMIKDQRKNNDFFVVQSVKWIAVIFVIYKLNGMFYYEYSGYSKLYESMILRKYVCAIITAFLVFDVSIIKKSMRVIAYIIFLSMVFIPFVDESFMSIVSDGGDNFSGYMAFGYSILPGIIMLWHMYFKEKKKIDLIFAFIGVAELFIYANRGAVVAVIIYIVLYQILCSKAENRLRNIILLILLAIVAYNIMNPQNLVRINEFLNSIGIYSRNITKLLDETISVSGREYIYENVFEELGQLRMIGRGIFGDRFILFGSYPHNIFLEVLIQFGWSFGLIALSIFFGFMLYALIAKKYEVLRAETLVFICIIMIKLMLSSSYLFEYHFYFLCAYLLNLKFVVKNKKTNENVLEEKKELTDAEENI